MANLLNAQITAAVSAGTPGGLLQLMAAPRNLTVQANFTPGTGGTSVTAYLQTSLDGGTTWADIACFAFTTAAARKALNFSSQTPVTSQVTLTNGSMTANTAQDGLLGAKFQVIYGSVGTYAGASLTIDVQCDELRA